jgi:hypothetical protein
VRAPRRASRGALLALGLAAACGLCACAAPPDEAWLRIVAFEDSKGASLTVLETWLQEGTTTESVRMRVENHTSNAGLSGGGIGILVRGVRVETFAGGRALRVEELPVTLYLPSGDAAAGAAAESGTTLEVPVFTPALKRWVLDNLVVPEEGLGGSARVTVNAVTDEGRELATSGGFGLRIVDGTKPASN